MNITDKTVPYEILIRFGDDGTVQGGHYQERRIVELDGERLKDEVSHAKPLGDSPDEVKALLPGAALTAFSEIDRLNGLQADHEREVATLRDRLAEATEAARVAGLEVESLKRDFAELQAEAQSLRADVLRQAEEIERLTEVVEEQAPLIADLQAELAEARAQITDLTAPVEEEPV